MKCLKSCFFIPFVALLFGVAVPAAGPLKGPSFTAPGQTFEMPSEWMKKPIRYEKWADNADISVTLEQDVYQLILPLIQKYAKQRGLTIAVKEGTCGISAGMLNRKVVDIGGFCCPPGGEDRLPGLKFHTLGIVAKAFLLHPDNPDRIRILKRAEGHFPGEAVPMVRAQGRGRQSRASMGDKTDRKVSLPSEARPLEAAP
jgi:hypothetical protein